jgi:hypothetical protein
MKIFAHSNNLHYLCRVKIKDMNIEQIVSFTTKVLTVFEPLLILAFVGALVFVSGAFFIFVCELISELFKNK